jgi:site-specific recombinase XerD
MMGKFRWWLAQEGLPDRLEAITAETIRFFLAYLRGDAGTGRWGSDRPNAARPVRPSTVDTYYRALRAFFNFVVREGLLDESPLRKVRPPRLPKDLLPPFTPEQAQALVDAAKQSNQAARNVALVLILLNRTVR